MSLRRLGVYGENLATKKDRTVSASDFSIAGLVGKFDRKYGKAFEVKSSQDARIIFGPQTNSAAYGWDALSGFFANLAGFEGSAYVLSFKGASCANAAASLNNTDSVPEPILSLKAAYQDELEYGLAGNRTGYTLDLGVSFSAQVVTLPTGTGATARVVTLASVAGIKVGDVIDLTKTGFHELHFVTAIDEVASTVTWADADYAGTGTAADYTLGVVAMKIHIWLKDTRGVVAEADTDLGKTWVTLNSADPDKYVSNVFARSSYMSATVLTVTGAPTATQTFPAAVATVAYLAGGLDGTDPVTVNTWAALYALFDNLPVRFLANVETANADYQKGLETYARARADNPMVILGGSASHTKATALAAGQAFQRSDEVDAIYVHNWLKVSDPFATSTTAKDRNVPAAGHLMGFAISGIAEMGIHVVPAIKTRALKGANDVVGEQALSDYDRTDLAEAGANVIQNVTGRGLIVRNWFTPSTDAAFRYGNALLMRNYIKVSAVDSLQDSENTPNDIAHVREDRSAFLQFMNRLWLRGSTGNAREGETFGQYENADGSVSTREDAFEVVGDASNNPVSVLQAGNRNIDCWFMFPAPAGSIKIGVGLIYKVA
jgi:hypothetical protein